MEDRQEVRWSFAEVNQTGNPQPTSLFWGEIWNVKLAVL